MELRYENNFDSGRQVGIPERAVPGWRTNEYERRGSKSAARSASGMAADAGAPANIGGQEAGQNAARPLASDGNRASGRKGAYGIARGRGSRRDWLWLLVFGGPGAALGPVQRPGCANDPVTLMCHRFSMAYARSLRPGP